MEFIAIGKCLKPHKLNGGLKIQFHHFLLDTSLNSLFIGRADKPIPYFIEELRAISDEVFIAKLEGVDTPEDAMALRNQTIYHQKEVVDQAFELPADDEWLASDLVDFTLYDQNDKNLGIIKDVLEFNEQWVAVLTIQEKEVLIPISEELILDMNDQKQTIKVQVPDGLVDLYLGES